jgi:hypothetical protein
MRQEFFNEDQLKRIEKIINAETTAASVISKAINPIERFDFSADEAAFFKYYNKYDIRTVSGLLVWQKFALDKIIGGSVKPNYKKFIRNRRLDRNQFAAVKLTIQIIEGEILLRDVNIIILI